MQKPTEEIFVEIIREFMGLPVNQVWIRDQNRKIPNDTNLYIIVGMVDSRPYGAKYEMVERWNEGDPEPYQVEVTTTNVRENMQIDILSRSNEAILRKNDVYLALNSIASKQAQELYDFKIARIPTNFVNSSAAEGGSNINRFTMVVPSLVWYSKERVITEYYDNFRTRIDDEKTIATDSPIIEFEQGETQPIFVMVGDDFVVVGDDFVIL